MQSIVYGRLAYNGLKLIHSVISRSCFNNIFGFYGKLSGVNLSVVQGVMVRIV